MAADLTITGLIVFTIVLPVKIPRRHGIGDVGGSVTDVVLRLHRRRTHRLGRGRVMGGLHGTAEAAAAALHVHLRPLVVGADAMRTERPTAPAPTKPWLAMLKLRLARTNTSSVTPRRWSAPT